MLFIVGVATLALGGCGSSNQSAITTQPTTAASSSTTTTVAISTSTAESGIRSVAEAYARAWLVGTFSDINWFNSRSCAATPPGVTPQVAAAGLRQLRLQMQGAMHVALASITIRGVAVRNFTGRAGEAEVLYHLPESVAGNDNWIPYAIESGRWKVTDCTLLPIGGSGSEATTTVITTIPPNP